MSDWFQAFREECQKHDFTKFQKDEAVALLREVYEVPVITAEWRKRVATFLKSL